MKTDLQLKAEITEELAWDPAVSSDPLTVEVAHGIATLSGEVDSFAEHYAVERAVRRVAGVRGVNMLVEVNPPAAHARDDDAIAQAVRHALHWHSSIPDGSLQIEVHGGWVALFGEVDWAYQKAAAEQCARPLRGVRGVTSNITIRPRADAQDIAGQIAAAFDRHALREARRIVISVEGSMVTLRGKVSSMAEHKAALGTAWAAHGVTRVIDRLEVVT